MCSFFVPSVALVPATLGGLGAHALVWAVVALAALITILCWARARAHSRAVLSLTGLSQQILTTRMDPEKVYDVIRSHVCQLAPQAALVVQLEPISGPPVPITVLPGGRVASEADRQAIGLGAYEWLQAHRRPLVVPNLERSPMEPLRLEGAVRSAVYIPLVAGDRFLGAFSLQSPKRLTMRGRLQTSLAVCAEQVALGLESARLYRREQERAAQLLLISEVSRKVAAILDLDTLFADTVRLVQETLGYYHVSIFSIDREAGVIELQASSSPQIQRRGLRVTWGVGLIGHAALGEVILANDVREDPRFLPDAALDRTAAELSLPLIVEDRVLGVLDLQSDQCYSFGEDEISTLRILADQIAIAIEDSQIYRAQQEQSWVSTALLQVAEALAREATLDDISLTVPRLTRLLLGVERCVILAYLAEAHAYQPLPDVVPTGESSRAPYYPAEEIPLLRRLELGRTAMAASAQDLGPLAPLLEAQPTELGRVFAYPLAPRGRLLGVLLVQVEEQQEWQPPQQTVLEGIANQTAMAMDSAALLAAQQEEAWVSTALLQVATVVAGSSYDLRETTTTVVRLAPMLVGLTWCAILVRDPEGERYYGMASYGLSPDLQDQATQPSYSLGELPWLAKLQEEIQEVTRLSPGAACAALGLRPRRSQGDEILALPLRAQQRELGLLLVGIPREIGAVSGRRLALLSGIATQTSLAIAAARLYEQSVRQERLEHEMRLAREIQASFLPEASPQIPGWRIAVDWRAASGVGGDYYDLMQAQPNELTLCIADVSDKGVAAALYMALSRTVLRAAALDAHSPVEILQRANRVLLEDSRSGMFVSLVYGHLDLHSGRLRYVRAGHTPLLLVRAADRSVIALEPNGVVLGVIPDPELEEAVVELAPGDALVLYTDGVTEAWNEREEEFGLERLQAVIQQSEELTPEALIASINEAVQQFVGSLPQADDYTLLVIQREPEN